MEYEMEEFSMEWKIFKYGMKRNILKDMEYGKFLFHSIP